MLLASCMLVLIGCADRQITSSLVQTASVEGRRYAEEVDAQSPFKTVELRWIEAGELIKERNPSFVASSKRYSQALEGKPLVSELTREVKDTVTESLGTMLDIDTLVSSLKAPSLEIPKRIASISRLKDVSHEVKQGAWEDAGTSVDAELEMRKVEVQLHRLMRTGKLINREIEKARPTPILDPDSEQKPDPKFMGALNGWRSSLKKERSNWLTEVRNLFDAEYQDVHFIPDDSGLPTYRNAENPDLGEWRRWCHLRRSKELIGELAQSHQESKPTLPGTNFVAKSLKQMVNKNSGATTVRDTDSVRGEVRALIQSWRSMKEAQQQAELLEELSSDLPLQNQAEIQARQKIFQLRKAEIKYASVVWLLDEDCWQNSELGTVVVTEE
jgi:hypothetical protein